jgi:hypothetical protein
MTLHALFVHSALEARQRFRTVSAETRVFSELHLASTFGEGLQRLRSQGRWGALYLGGSYDAPTLGHLIEAMRSTREGRACSFMFHLEDQNEVEFFRSAVECGVDGFLASKFTAEDLKESVKVAQQAHARRLSANLWSDLFAWGRTSALTAIDEAARLAKVGEDSREVLAKATRIRPRIGPMTPEAQEHYLMRLGAVFDTALPAPELSSGTPARFSPQERAGPSSAARIVRR